MSVLTFDWAQIAFNLSPLATPWWAQANVLGGFVLFFWIITPALYFSNIWYAQYLPILSSHAFDNTGQYYNVTAILTSQNTLDQAKYEAYSPLFLPTVFAISYGLSFASVCATLSHALFYFRKQIWVQSKRSLSEMPDIHARLMAKYQEVPDWWYGAIFLSNFVLAIICIEVWPSELPVWALIVALLIAFVYVVPIGMIQAITKYVPSLSFRWVGLLTHTLARFFLLSQQVGLNVITELIVGYALPGRPIAMMMFKTWGYIAMAQAITLTSDFKLGHYMKIPPRPMFWAQIIASIVALTTQLGVQAWMFSHIKNMCTSDADNGFICLNTTVFGTASIIWGVISCVPLSLSLSHLCVLCSYVFITNQSRQYVRPWETLPPSVVLLPHWCRHPRNHLLPRQTMAKLMAQISQHSRRIHRNREHATRHSRQLHPSSHHMLPIQPSHSSSEFLVVVEI